jgi:integrase
LSFEAADQTPESIPTDEIDPLTAPITNSDAPRSVQYKNVIWRFWREWWLSSKCPHPIDGVSAIAQFARHLESIGYKAGHRFNVCCALRGWIAADPNHDPEVIRLLTQISTATWHAHKRENRREKVPIFGRIEIDRLILAADPLSPKDARDVSALLVQYETMAAPDQIFGFSLNGQRIASPMLRTAVSFRDDGTANLEIPAVTMNQARVADLSIEATRWLRTWIDSRTDCHPELFIGRDGPMAYGAWRGSVDDVARRAGFRSSSIRGLRRGREHELIVSGARDGDLRQALTRRSLRPLDRAKQTFKRGNSRAGLGAAQPSLSGSIRHATRMRAYCRDLFLGAG